MQGTFLKDFENFWKFFEIFLWGYDLQNNAFCAVSFKITSQATIRNILAQRIITYKIKSVSIGYISWGSIFKIILQVFIFLNFNHILRWEVLKCFIHFDEYFDNSNQCVKSVCNRSYSVSLRIQSECGKVRTRIAPNTENFYAMNVCMSWGVTKPSVSESFIIQKSYQQSLIHNTYWKLLPLFSEFSRCLALFSIFWCKLNAIMCNYALLQILLGYQIIKCYV